MGRVLSLFALALLVALAGCARQERPALPAPTSSDFEEYAATLKEAGIDAHFVREREDYIVIEKLRFRGPDIRSAFEVGRVLLGIPDGITLPALGSSVTKVENPDKAPYMWSDEMEVEWRDGSIVQIHYYARREGGGIGGWIRRSDDGTLELERDLIAD